MERIKKISQKDSTGNFPSYPIGADGKFIDMLSGNNLEEELHLGSPSLTSFNVNPTTKAMTIVEEFKKDSQTYYYIMRTSFETINNKTKIIQKLFLKKDGIPEALKKIKTTTFESTDGNLEIKEVIN